MILADILRAFVYIIHLLIQLYILIIIVRSFMSWMGEIPRHPLVTILYRLTDPLFRFVHRRLPFLIVGGIDITPIIIIIVLYFIDHLLMSWMLHFVQTMN